MDENILDKFIDLIQKVGFPIVVAFGLLWFSNNVYKDSLVREERLVNRIDAFEKTLKELSETLKLIDVRLDSIEQQSAKITNTIPASTSGR